MAATIVAGVCEDHQHYKLLEPSTTENLKRKNRFLTPNKTYLNHSQPITSILKPSFTLIQ